MVFLPEGADRLGGRGGGGGWYGLDTISVLGVAGVLSRGMVGVLHRAGAQGSGQMSTGGTSGSPRK